jgi:hypothetical protein
MIGTLAWKEYREQRSFWIALSVLVAGLGLGLPAFLETLGPNHTAGKPHVVLSLLVGALTVIYGLVSGSMMLAGEREGRTLAFLDALTGQRATLWKTKLATGAVLVTTFALLQALLLILFVVASVPESRWELLELLILPPLAVLGLIGLGLSAFAWGMMMSAVFSNVLAALASSVLSFGLMSLLPGAIGALLEAWGVDRVLVVVTQVIPMHLGFPLAALYGSRRVFCRNDRTRLEEARRSPEPLAPNGAPTGWSQLLWLTWRQGRLVVVSVAVATPLIVFALMLSHADTVWPQVSCLVGTNARHVPVPGRPAAGPGPRLGGADGFLACSGCRRPGCRLAGGTAPSREARG